MKVSALDVQLTREQLARHEFIVWRMGDVPTIYLSLMPVTDDAAELLKAETQIRRMLADDVASYTAEQQRWWMTRGTKPKFVNFDNVASTAGFGLTLEAPEGYPGWVKPGEGIDPRDGQRKRYAEFIDYTEFCDSPAQRAIIERNTVESEKRKAERAEYLKSRQIGGGEAAETATK